MFAFYGWGSIYKNLFPFFCSDMCDEGINLTVTVI